MQLILSLGVDNRLKTFGEALDLHLRELHEGEHFTAEEQDKTVVYVLKKYADSPIARSDSIAELNKSFTEYHKQRGYGCNSRWEDAIKAGDWPVTIPV